MWQAGTGTVHLASASGLSPGFLAETDCRTLVVEHRRTLQCSRGGHALRHTVQIDHSSIASADRWAEDEDVSLRNKDGLILPQTP